MAKTRPAQLNFTRGELSRYITARPDLAPYQNGLVTGANIIVLPEGGVTKRPGTRLIQFAKYTNQLAILIPFIRSQSLAYVIEAGAGYFRFYKGTGQIQAASGPNLVVNGDFN